MIKKIKLLKIIIGISLAILIPLAMLTSVVIEDIIEKDVRRMDESSKIKISEILTSKEFLNYIIKENLPLMSMEATISYLKQDARFIKKYYLEKNLLHKSNYENNFINDVCARGYLLNIKIDQYPKEIDCKDNYVNYYLDNVEEESVESILENINVNFSKK